MDHKAFVFDYARFDRELRPTLESALTSGQVAVLRDFIVTNLDSVRDPYEGEELPINWEDDLETGDVHEYGDYAITRYYNPDQDIGIGANWLEVEATLPASTRLLLLGKPVGDPVFDPGRMGSYFQSADDVEVARERLLEALKDHPLLSVVTEIMSAARGRGLYVTF